MDRYIVITVIILLGAFGFPMPVPLTGLLAGAGLFAAHGQLCVVLLILLATAGAIFGDTLGYLTGHVGVRLYRRHGGVRPTHASPLMYRLREAAGRIIASRAIRRTLRWSDGRLSHGGSMAAMIVLSRTVLGVFGPVINVLSGVRRYPLGRFLLYDAIGEGLWVGAYVGLGFAAGMRGSNVHDLLRNPIAVAIGIILTLFPLALVARMKPTTLPVTYPIRRA